MAQAWQVLQPERDHPSVHAAIWPVHYYWAASTRLPHGQGQRPRNIKPLDPLNLNEHVRQIIDLDVRRVAIGPASSLLCPPAPEAESLPEFRTCGQLADLPLSPAACHNYTGQAGPPFFCLMALNSSGISQIS